MLSRISKISVFCFCCLNMSSFSAQNNHSWWKNIFRSECDTTQSEIINEVEIDTISNIGSVEFGTLIQHDSLFLEQSLPQLPVREGAGNVVIYMDSTLTELNLATLNESPTLKGYRVQIHFGELESARAVKAKCRKQLSGNTVYLESIAPNYSVVVGDYRDRWEAEIALVRLKKLYPRALIVPSEIELPKL